MADDNNGMMTLKLTDGQFEVIQELVNKHIKEYKQAQLDSMMAEMASVHRNATRNGRIDMCEYMGLVANYTELLEVADEVIELFDPELERAKEGV